MTINELRERRKAAWEKCKDFLDKHRTENGTLSADDAAAYDKMEQEIDTLGKEISRLERLEQLENDLKKPTSTPITGQPMNGFGEPKTGRASDEYNKAVLDFMRSGFRRVSDVLQEGVDGDGGYLVPEEMDSRIIEAMDNENIMRSLATVITTTGTHKINVSTSMPAAAWVDEGEALTFGDGKFGQIMLDAHKLYVGVKVTEELLYDNAFNLSSFITSKFGSALANKEEEAFLVGIGGNSPTGIFAETGGGTVASVLSAAIKSDDILDLSYALKRPYRKNAAFIMNDKTVASIRKLKDNNGAYMWQPSYQMGEPDTLLGFKLYTSSYAPEGAIAFGDFSYYNIGDRGMRSFSELRELFAGNGMIGFLAKERVDGKLVLPEAVQIIKPST